MTEAQEQADLPKRDLTAAFNKLTEEQQRLLVVGFVLNRMGLQGIDSELEKIAGRTTDEEQLSAIAFLRLAALHQKRTMYEVIADDTDGLAKFPDLPDLCEFAFTGKKPPTAESGKEEVSEGDRPT